MKNMKYIILESKIGLLPVIFSKWADHDTMADMTKMALLRGRGSISAKAVSAGFIDANGKCSGESVSLGLKSRPIDTQLIEDVYSEY